MDVNGITTGYAYDTGAARLYRTTAANGTQQDYRYCTGSDRTALTYINGVASIRYTYDRAQLSDLIRKGYLGSTGFWQHYLLNYDAFGNMTRVQVCASSAEQTGYTSPVTLASYTYEGNVNNGRLTTMTYGNGDSVSYTYDAFDRQRTAAYNDGTTYHYDYSSDNDLTRQYATDGDGKVTEQYSYQYDSLGRLIHSRQSTANGALIQSTQHMYDAANRMTSQSWQFGTGLYRQQYSYTGVKADGTTDSSVDGTISAITTTIPNQLDVTSKYEYNDLRQLEKKTVTVPNQNRGTTTVYTRSYTYSVIAEDKDCNRVGTRLASTAYTFGSSSRGFTYTYDAAGNISRIVTAGTSVPTAAASKEYGYDAQGQLATETNGGASRAYAYDTVGNIRSVTTDGAVIKSFGYTNPSWPDLLTSVTVGGTTKDILYEGQTQTSGVPSSGNPVTYYNGKDYSFTWTKGRQLTSATVDGEQVSYTYDMSGVRSNKQVGDTTYTYTTLSGKVMRQQWDGKTLEFVYDDGSQPFAMIYKHGQTTELYYYVLNVQGDVSAILDSSGKLAASYDYDAWGNCTVYNNSDAAIGDLNPLRYRGYYYDAETGFYYLQSRYYDFANCRFINADTFATTDANGVLSANMFAYCENNPVMRTDETGNDWQSLAVKMAIGTLAIAIGVGVTAATGGAALPALVAGIKAACVAGAISAGMSATSTAVRSASAGNDLSTVVNDSLNSAANGFADGFMAGGIMAGASQVASAGFKIAANLGVATGRNGGIKLGNMKILSPDAPFHKNNGGTLFKLGKSFRVDVGSNTLLHMHIPRMKPHFPIGSIGAGIYGWLRRWR